MKQSSSSYDIRIDIVKSLAILSVILLHSSPKYVLVNTFAQLHIWQAVPIFLVLMGYTFLLSMENKEVSLKSFRIKKRLIRVIIPMLTLSLVVLGIEYIFHIDFQFTYFLGVFPLLKGPGTYYLILVIEAIIILPLLYILNTKVSNIYKFLFIVFVLNLLFEYFSYWIELYKNQPLLYTSSILRYLFALGIGFYIYTNYEKFFTNKYFILFLFISFMYLFTWGIYQHKVPYFIEIKKWQNLFSYLYSGLLLFMLFRLIDVIKHLIPKIFVTIGQASWHIFLFQVIYFGAGTQKFIIDYLKNHYAYSFGFIGFSVIVLNLIFIVGIGIYWYKIEYYLNKRLKGETKRTI